MYSKLIFGVSLSFVVLLASCNENEIKTTVQREELKRNAESVGLTINFEPNPDYCNTIKSISGTIGAGALFISKTDRKELAKYYRAVSFEMIEAKEAFNLAKKSKEIITGRRVGPVIILGVATAYISTNLHNHSLAQIKLNAYDPKNNINGGCSFIIAKDSMLVLNIYSLNNKGKMGIGRLRIKNGQTTTIPPADDELRKLFEYMEEKILRFYFDSRNIWDITQRI